MKRLRATVELFVEAGRRWSESAAPRLAAAISFYAVLSVVPLVVITVAVAGAVFGPAAATEELARRLAPVAGPRATELVTSLMTQAGEASASVPATLAGLLLLFYSASGVFIQLKVALDVMWGIPYPQGRVRLLLRTRLAAFALVACAGLLLIASVLADVARSMVVAWLGATVEWRVPSGDSLLSFIVLFTLVALIFRVLPVVRIGWRDVALGAALTTVLLFIGMRLIALYFSYKPFMSIYGAAASVVVFLLWVHYSSMVFLYGAECAHVLALRHGSLRPESTDGVGIA